ncbi:hypothetical protein ACRALDRAFT_211765 [Sodiomyces alcalophilus JCM 7366]|uniref:uncharacterized protein n=1 Tax=Sodiomyces alcalophilus JCM 7366 TaxID=591952 RepID=UPI0039B649F8
MNVRRTAAAFLGLSPDYSVHSEGFQYLALLEPQPSLDYSRSWGWTHQPESGSALKVHGGRTFARLRPNSELLLPSSPLRSLQSSTSYIRCASYEFIATRGLENWSRVLPSFLLDVLLPVCTSSYTSNGVGILEPSLIRYFLHLRRWAAKVGTNHRLLSANQSPLETLALPAPQKFRAASPSPSPPDQIPFPHKLPAARPKTCSSTTGLPTGGKNAIILILYLKTPISYSKPREPPDDPGRRVMFMFNVAGREPVGQGPTPELTVTTTIDPQAGVAYLIFSEQTIVLAQSAEAISEFHPSSEHTAGLPPPLARMIHYIPTSRNWLYFQGTLQV